MRRLIWLALVAWLAWRFLGRRARAAEESVTIGYADGSSVTLDAGSPETDRLLQTAAEARGA